MTGDNRCPRASQARNVGSLLGHLFQHKWCYRPKEMLPDWTNLSHWCVWGFANPEVPGACSRT